KVMAMASSGTEEFADAFRAAVDVREGRYSISPLDLAAIGGAKRKPGEPVEQRHLDLARAAQVVVEEVALDLARWLHRETGARSLSVAGGVALNCVMNARMRDEGPFENVFVQPAAGDAGTSLGAAFLAYVEA